MFVHVETRRRARWHWATLLIVSVCVLCFLVLSLLPPLQRVALLLEYSGIVRSE